MEITDATRKQLPDLLGKRVRIVMQPGWGSTFTGKLFAYGPRLLEVHMDADRNHDRFVQMWLMERIELADPQE